MGAAGVGSGGMLEAAFWYLCAGSGPRFTEEGTKVQGGGQEALQPTEPGTSLGPNLSLGLQVQPSRVRGPWPS